LERSWLRQLPLVLDCVRALLNAVVEVRQSVFIPNCPKKSMPEPNGKVAHIWKQDETHVLQKYHDGSPEEPLVLEIGELLGDYIKGLSAKLKREGYAIRFCRPEQPIS
jgi:hypothetical protein